MESSITTRTQEQLQVRGATTSIVDSAGGVALERPGNCASGGAARFIDNSTEDDMTKRVVLVSCVKTKGDSAVAAKDMYISPLFKGMRRYAEQNADAWYILSAEHGVLQPDQIIVPYERTLRTMQKPDRMAWDQQVRKQLLELIPAGAEVIFLAGIRYREGVAPFLKCNGFKTEIPMEGKKFGLQLSWLKENAK